MAPIVILMSGNYVGPQQLTQILALLAGWGARRPYFLQMASSAPVKARVRHPHRDHDALI